MITDCQVKPVVNHQCRMLMHRGASSPSTNDQYSFAIYLDTVDRRQRVGRKTYFERVRTDIVL